MSSHLSDNVKHAADVLSLTTVLATLAAWLPPLAALVSIIWGVIRIYETDTVRGWRDRRKAHKCAVCQVEAPSPSAKAAER
jgi:hypothetical protein